MLTLAQLSLGSSGTILGFQDESWEVVLMEHGFVVGQTVHVSFVAPMKGPIAVKVGESVISMRYEEAEAVLVQ